MIEEVSPEEATRLERDKNRRLMRALPEFNNLCAFVLDACVFNLIEEDRLGDFWGSECLRFHPRRGVRPS